MLQHRRSAFVYQDRWQQRVKDAQNQLAQVAGLVARLSVNVQGEHNQNNTAKNCEGLTFSNCGMQKIANTCSNIDKMQQDISMKRDEAGAVALRAPCTCLLDSRTQTIEALQRAQQQQEAGAAHRRCMLRPPRGGRRSASSALSARAGSGCGRSASERSERGRRRRRPG
jgi:hypothetical protein